MLQDRPPAGAACLYSTAVSAPIVSSPIAPSSGDGQAGGEAMAQAQQRRLASINVGDPRLYREDTWRPQFARLRGEDPVHYRESPPYGPYWSVTRYADIMKVELDHGTYSSASELGGIQIADQPKGQELPNFIRMDPPRPHAQRKTVAPIVAPSNLANMEALIRERTAACSMACRAARPSTGSTGLDRTHHDDAGDPVRLPVGGSRAS